VVLVALPEPGSPQIVDLRANRREETSLFREVNKTPGVRITLAFASIANRIPSLSSINSGSELSSITSTMASLARMKASLTKPFCFSAVLNGPHGQPRCHHCLYQVRYRETRSTNDDFLKYGLWCGDIAKEAVEQLKVTERGKINEGAAVGDDQELANRGRRLSPG